MSKSKNTNHSRASQETSATRHPKKRQEAPYSATPTLNERMRKNGKWVFLALAVVFGITFVFAGVGTSGPSLVDLIGQNNDSSPTTTAADSSAVQKAEAATKASPEDPQVWLDLAQAEVAAGQLDKVPAAAEQAATLAPKDATVQAAIADVYLAQAAAALQKAQTMYAEAQGGGTVNGRSAVPQQVIPGQSSGATPFQTAQESIASAKFSDVSAKVSPLQTEASDAYKAAVEAQTIVTEINADDPAAWFRLGQIATAANDTTGAIAAYERFVKLAPDDPLTSKVKDEIKRLQDSLTSSTIPTQ
ncbi:MAG: tetratricopeptide repeat protein [Actinobacteria bacterium]|nr:tetratricopeptide repeat protein [Actinomycetota bacterium]